ncbi:MAG: hypothetical protein K2P58_03330 [Hyphomonadaceae bacterium]|nr:hypothetical protein [Hyphomonadaceae bacterium]
MKVVTEKPIEEIDDETLVLADMGRKATEEIAREVRALLPDPTTPEKAAEIAEILTDGRWTHDYGLSAREVADIGSSISQEMPREVMALMNLYQQPLRRSPAVEFSPYRRDPLPAINRRRGG